MGVGVGEGIVENHRQRIAVPRRQYFSHAEPQRRCQLLARTAAERVEGVGSLNLAATLEPKSRKGVPVVVELDGRVWPVETAEIAGHLLAKRRGKLRRNVFLFRLEMPIQ